MSDKYQKIRWWEKEGDEAGKIAFDRAESIDEQTNLDTKMARLLRRYTSRSHETFKPTRMDHFDSVPYLQDRDELEDEKFGPNINTLRSIIETLRSRITVHKTRTRISTYSGKWSDRRKGRDLQRYLDGENYRCKTHKERSKAFVDLMWCGIGYVRVGLDSEMRPYAERVFPSEILPDVHLTGDCRILYRVRALPREMVLAQYADDKELCRKIRMSSAPSGMTDTDLVQYVEGWHLPSSEKAKDGKYICAVNGGLLHMEEYDHDKFPFAIGRWTEMPAGWWGQGICESGWSIQREQDKLFKRISESMHLLATAWVVCDEGSIDEEHLDNIPGTLVKRKVGSRGSIEVKTPSSMNSEVFAHAKYLRGMGFEDSGLNQMSASATKPPGIEAGVALRELNASQDARFAAQQEVWDDMQIQIDELLIYFTRKAAQSGGSPSTIYVGDRGLQRINWSQIGLKPNSFVLRLFPTSLLPLTPSGRLSIVQELMQAGLISPEVGKDLLNSPDIDAAMDLENAPIEALDKAVEAAIDDGTEMGQPQPWDRLELHMLRVAQYISLARIDNVPEDRIGLLVQYMALCQSTLIARKQALEPQMVQQPTPMGEALPGPLPDASVPAPQEVI